MKERLNFRRKFKYYFFKYKLHRLVPASGFLLLGQMAAISKWIQTQEQLGYTDFPVNHFDYSHRYQLYDHVYDTEIGDADVDYLEFGVAGGNSFKWWANKITTDGSRLYGFDTFTGLPEDWGPYKKGTFSTGNQVPELNDDRCTFYQGIFQATLFDFLKSYTPERKKIIHLDADLYTSTLFVLTTLTPYLQKGDILLFDEFNVPLHEFRAFTDWVSSFYINYTVLGEVNNFFQVAMRLE